MAQATGVTGTGAGDARADGDMATGAAAAIAEAQASLPPEARFSQSLFGQLYRKVRGWTSEYRRNYVFREDKGQGRSFKVQFTGETVQDNGGPYRAVLEQVAATEPCSVLALFQPCDNAQLSQGANLDKCVPAPVALDCPVPCCCSPSHVWFSPSAAGSYSRRARAQCQRAHSRWRRPPRRSSSTRTTCACAVL